MVHRPGWSDPSGCPWQSSPSVTQTKNHHGTSHLPRTRPPTTLVFSTFRAAAPTQSSRPEIATLPSETWFWLWRMYTSFYWNHRETGWCFPNVVCFKSTMYVSLSNLIDRVCAAHQTTTHVCGTCSFLWRFTLRPWICA